MPIATSALNPLTKQAHREREKRERQTEIQTYRVHPHQELPALVKGKVDQVKQGPRSDGVCDILHVRKSVNYPSFLCAHN